MLKIGRDEYDRLYEAVARAGASIETLDGKLIVVTLDRLRPAVLAALSAMAGDHVLVENEIHLVPAGTLADIPGRF